MSSPSLRPAGAYIHGTDGPVAIVTGRTAAWLLQNTDLARLRVEQRGTDAEVDAGLGAITYAANAWRATSEAGSSAGSGLGVPAEAAPVSEAMTAQQAADALGIGDRAVRLAITEGRLPATQVDGRWRINPDDVNRYRANRAA